MSIFGSNTNTANPTANPLQAQPTLPALFGNTNTSNTTGGGGLFGSINTNPNQHTGGGTSGGGLFGGNQPGGTNTTNQPATNSLFGTSSNTNPTGTTSIFGTPSTNTNTTTAPGTSIFGSTANANTNPSGNTSIFGNTQPSTNTTPGNLFGNAPQQTQNNPTPLFGGAANSSTNSGTTGGLFGSTTSNVPGGGLFGSTANANTQQQQQQQQQQPNTTGGGIFGNTQAGGTSLFGVKPAGTGLFGSTTNTTTNTNPFLGQQQQQQLQPQQQQPQQQPSSLFGSSNTLFGGNKSAFGTTAQPNNNLNVSALTAPNNLLASRSGSGGQQQSADPQAQFTKLIQSIEGVYNAWNPSSKDCRFQYNFYNLVDPKQVSLYGRPPNATNDALWEKAVRENPDPSCLVPVIAVGFDDLRARIEAQTSQSTAHIQKLNELRSRLSALRTEHSVSNASRILRAASMQTQQTQRIMRVVQHLHLLIPSVRSSALRPEEEALRGKLEEIEEEMRRGRVKGRLNELWALIGAVGAGVEKAGGSGSSGAGGEWVVVDEDGLAQITQILAEQQAGLQHLTKILQKDLKDLNIIMGNSSANVTQEEGAVVVGSVMHEGG